MAKRKINTRPEKSVMDCVKEFIAAGNTTFTLKDLMGAYTDKPKNQLATALWKLRSNGTVTKHEDGRFTVLTGVNAPAPEQKPSHSEAVKGGMAKAIRKLNSEVADYKKTLDRADRVYEELSTRYQVLQSTHTSLQQHHEGALAIIRYLENKLYVVIKQANKNGSNS